MNAVSGARGARRRQLVVPAALCVLSAALFAGCVAPPKSATTQAASRCVELNGLPDRDCTPGAIRSGAPLATICAFGYSHGVRPPESFTEPLKLAQMRAYRLPGSPSDYE